MFRCSFLLCCGSYHSPMVRLPSMLFSAYASTSCFTQLRNCNTSCLKTGIETIWTPSISYIYHEPVTNIPSYSDGTKLYPGNCDDNTNEPPFGATCVESSPTAGDASCHINAGPSSSSTGTSLCEPTATVTVTETVSTCPATVTGPTTTPIIAGNATATGNSSLPYASLTYSSSLPSPTFQSGGDLIRSTGFGMLMVAALMGAFGLV